MADGSSIPLNNVIKNSDVALAGGVIGMLLIMVVPLPEIVLDLMIALSISIAVLIQQDWLYMVSLEKINM